MTCCGKKALSIASGTAKHVAIDIFHLGPKCDMADTRLYICHQCDEQTWMTKRELLKWVWDNAKDVIKNFEDLTKLPRLPKVEKAKGKGICCRLCKCFIPSKVYEKNEVCPKGKWK